MKRLGNVHRGCRRSAGKPTRGKALHLAPLAIWRYESTLSMGRVPEKKRDKTANNYGATIPLDKMSRDVRFPFGFTFALLLLALVGVEPALAQAD